MKPGRLNIDEEKRGARFTLGVDLCDETETPVDLTGYTAALRIRYRADSPNVLLEATTENGRIVLGGTPYNLVADFDLDLPAGQYPYDLAVFSADGRMWPVVTGRFEVEASTV
jgi:hypothetical protein